MIVEKHFKIHKYVSSHYQVENICLTIGPDPLLSYSNFKLMQLHGNQ